MKEESVLNTQEVFFFFFLNLSSLIPNLEAPGTHLVKGPGEPRDSLSGEE